MITNPHLIIHFLMFLSIKIKNHNYLKINTLIFFLLIFFSCKKDKEIKISHKGFYYWKTNFQYHKVDNQLLVNDLGVEKLYVRFFDVGWQDDKAQPQGTTSFQDTLPKNLAIIPTVFITQDVVAKLPETEIDSLAKRIVIKIANTLQRQKIAQVTEIQIDCDWTAKSQATYFALLQQIKQHISQEFKHYIQLSCTIRLYPMKYHSKMGIPPVDKGVLMCYNLENPTIFGNQNSILSHKTAAAYLKSLSVYPLHVDIALPLFAWAVQFRNGKYLAILHEIRHKDFEQNTDFQMVEPNIFKAVQSTRLKNRDIQAGDILRIDAITTDELLQVKSLIYQNLSPDNQELKLLLFHYDTAIIKEFGKENVKKILE